MPNFILCFKIQERQCSFCDSFLDSGALSGVCFNRWARWQTVGCKPASRVESALNDLEPSARKVHGHRQTQTCTQSHTEEVTHRVHIARQSASIPQPRRGSSRLGIWLYNPLTYIAAPHLAETKEGKQKILHIQSPKKLASLNTACKQEIQKEALGNYHGW